MRGKQARAAGPITIPAFGGAIVRHVFGTRNRPSSAVLARGLRPNGPRVAVVSVKQIHGTDALIIDRPISPSTTFAGAWDAVITNQPQVMVTVRTADCVPVLMYCPQVGVVAAIHAGWRGSLAGIVPRTLDTMKRQFGAEPHTIRVAIGPSAGRCCYEVDRIVLDPLRQQYPYWRAVVQETSHGRGFLDLHELLRRQVAMAGVAYEHVWSVSLCTICHPSLFYSYRRDGSVKGTMISGIMLAPRARSSSRSRLS